MKDDWLDRWLKQLRHDGNQARATLFVMFVSVACLVWLIWGGVSVAWSRWAGADGTFAEAGQWGDSFGPLNALVSTLGFAAVLSTLILQNIALREQQNDQHLIRFETSFFELLKLLRELRAELSYTQTKEMQEKGTSNLVRKTNQAGFEAIKYACYEVRFLIELTTPDDAKASRQDVSAIYMKSVHKRFESRFAPYFRIIYTILHKVRRDSRLSEAQKAYYGNLLRAQLTSHEIALLGFNAMAPVAKDLDEHLVYFRMFKYLPEGTTRTILADVFPPEAFAART